MSCPLFNLYDPQLVQHLEQSKMGAKDPRGVKKARFDTTQPNSAQAESIGECSRQSTQTNQICNQNQQFIILSLWCPHCLVEIAKDQFSAHMCVVHHISPTRVSCLVKNCGQVFDNYCSLGKHIKQMHQRTFQWHCGKCIHYFTTYKKLSAHNTENHQLGHFKCFSCTFTGEYRRKVIAHYTAEHKTRRKKKGEYSQFETSFEASHSTHEGTHLDVPFHPMSIRDLGNKCTTYPTIRCKWPQCDYASKIRGSTIRHIRKEHLLFYSSPNGAQLDPREYAEEVHDL